MMKNVNTWCEGKTRILWCRECNVIDPKLIYLLKIALTPLNHGTLYVMLGVVFKGSGMSPYVIFIYNFIHNSYNKYCLSICQ